MKKFLATLLGILFSSSFAQTSVNQDVSGWMWFQLYQKLPKDFYVYGQYQLRLDHHISRFDLSNFYIGAGWDANRYINIEAMYQFSTSLKDDGHTFYGGITAKVPVKKFTFYFRTSFQHRRNNFTDIYELDNIKNEWRNRLRIRYKINKYFNTSVSFEPYLLFTENRPGHISRIRSTFHFSVAFNKYQSLTAFYLFQPDIITYSKPDILHVVGLIWQVKLPVSFKNFKKIFKSKIFKPQWNGKSSNKDDEDEVSLY
jgi:hypothetical protein